VNSVVSETLTGSQPQADDGGTLSLLQGALGVRLRSANRFDALAGLFDEVG